MDISIIITTALAIIGGATVGLRIIAPLTKTKIDNKILKWLELILSNISFDSKSKVVNLFKGDETINIKIKK